MLGWLLGWGVRAWIRTLRLTLHDAESSLNAEGPRVLAFFHGQQMALLRARRVRRTCVLTSLSRDGTLQAGVMTALGFGVLRGSSSRAGGRGALGVLRELTRGADAAFAVDGPRGPRAIAKPGAAYAAKRSGAALVPVASAATRRIVLRRAWDAFEVPLPFSRVAVVAGAKVDAAEASADPVALSIAIDAARARALSLLEMRRGSWQSG